MAFTGVLHRSSTGFQLPPEPNTPQQHRSHLQKSPQLSEKGLLSKNSFRQEQKQYQRPIQTACPALKHFSNSCRMQKKSSSQEHVPDSFLGGNTAGLLAILFLCKSCRDCPHCLAQTGQTCNSTQYSVELRD